MRLTRIIMATMVGLAVVAVPAAAGAAQPQPQPQPTPTTTPTDPPQPPYTPVPPSLSVDPATAFVGDPVEIVGRGFNPDEIVDIVLTRRPLEGGEGGGSLGVPLSAPDGDRVDDQAANRIHLTARTDSQGDFRIPFTPKRPGIYTITASSRPPDRKASTELRVLPRHQKPPHKPPHDLPVTGSSLETPLKVGGGLVATGTVLLLGTMLWRRRNRFGAGGSR